MNETDNSVKWLSFDPTIRAGHLITAVSIIGCTFSAWYGLIGKINALELQYAQHDKEISQVKKDAESTNDKLSARIDTIVSSQRQEIAMLREDMKGWFMNLDQKLDRKADRK